MPSFVALLRGVNVSGKRPLAMAKLAAALSKQGLRDVVTYKASGNVVFDSVDKSTARQSSTIRQVIAAEFGYDDVEVLVLGKSEAVKVARENPLLERSGIDPAFLHVTWPFGLVQRRAFDALEIPARGREAAVLSGGVVYLYCPDGYGRTKLNNSWFEKALRLPCTTRNWNTVVALAELVGSRGT